MSQHEIMECDVLIIGGGPAGLSASIRLRQLAQEAGKDISVIVLEKGSEVGAHLLAGAVLEPRALNELIPDWREKNAPLTVEAKEDHFLLLTDKKSFRLPTPPQMHNHGNYIISLRNFGKWLGEQAETLGVQIFPGFPARHLIVEEHQIKGIRTGEFGRSKEGEEKAGYQPPMEIRAKYTLFAEGARGHLTRELETLFQLREGRDPQTYGIGIKELWQVPPEQHQLGKVVHTVGWPLDPNTYGGSFLYHAEGGVISLGLVIGLDYQNPHLNPFKELQRFKHHPAIAAVLKGGKRIAYGARTINEGGWQSIPKLSFPGGALIGCSAGFVNVPKVKGIHTAMKSGMIAAELVAEQLFTGALAEIDTFESVLKKSWVGEELYAARNLRPAFRGGILAGMLYAALDTYILRGRAPWTFKHHADHTALKPAGALPKIDYPAPDGVLSFDLMSSVYLSNTNHEEDQPAHLTLKDATIPITHNLAVYDAPEQRYCPAGVYEIVREENQPPRLRINAQNCVHCKTCDIKDPSQNIVWVTPEGGGGPNYIGGM